MSKDSKPSKPSYFRASYFFAYMFLGLMLFSIVGYAVADSILSFKPKPLLMLTLAGAFGGLSYAIRDRNLELPHISTENDYTINLGLLADCFAGIAGAYIVFLVVPIQSDRLGTVEGDVRLLATGILGGYGGRSLVDQVLGGIVKQDVEAMKVQISRTRSQLEAVQDQSSIDANALALLHRQLDPKITLAKVAVDELKRLVMATSPTMKVHIFTLANEVRTKNWRSNKPLMERTIPVFEALAEADSDDQFHRNHGELGCALKDKIEPDWTRADLELSKAIALRNRHDKTGFAWYEFNRALCRIVMDEQFQRHEPSIAAQVEKILSDLYVANKDFRAIASLVAAEPNSPMSKWLKLNRISEQTLTKVKE